jgi:hypothetical protein
MIKLDEEYLFAYSRFTLSDGSVVGIRNDIVRYWGQHDLLQNLEKCKRHNPEDFIEHARKWLITPICNAAIIEDAREKLPKEPPNEIKYFTLRNGEVKPVPADIVQALGVKAVSQILKCERELPESLWILYREHINRTLKRKETDKSTETVENSNQ